MRADSPARIRSFPWLPGALLFILAGLSLLGCQGGVSRIQGEDLKTFSEGTLTLPRSEDNQAQAYYHFILGNLYAENDREAQALEEIQKALALRPDSPGLEFSLARLYIKTQQIPEALVHVRRAVELDPTFQDGYFLLAEIHISQGRWEGALEAYQKLAALILGRNFLTWGAVSSAEKNDPGSGAVSEARGRQSQF
jgi:tetratricopeptide (TPR) repeat protein